MCSSSQHCLQITGDIHRFVNERRQLWGVFGAYEASHLGIDGKSNKSSEISAPTTNTEIPPSQSERGAAHSKGDVVFREARLRGRLRRQLYAERARKYLPN